MQQKEANKKKQSFQDILDTFEKMEKEGKTQKKSTKNSGFFYRQQHRISCFI